MAQRDNDDDQGLKAVTEEWLARVKMAMEAKRMLPSHLAQALGKSRQSVSSVLSGSQQVSRLVGPISHELQIPLPDARVMADTEIDALLALLSEPQKELVLELMRQMVPRDSED